MLFCSRSERLKGVLQSPRFLNHGKISLAARERKEREELKEKKAQAVSKPTHWVKKPLSRNSSIFAVYAFSCGSKALFRLKSTKGFVEQIQTMLRHVTTTNKLDDLSPNGRL